MRRKRVLSATMMILGIWLLAGLCAAASDSEEEPGYMENIEESLMEEFDFQEIEEVLDELFPEEKLSFRETVLTFMNGDIQEGLDMAKRLIKDQFTYAFRVNKNNLIHILLIVVVAAVFTNFSSVFQNKQISEISFYVLYLLLIALCLRSFQASVDWVSDGIGALIDFMKVLGPVYFVAVAIGKGSVTSAAF